MSSEDLGVSPKGRQASPGDPIRFLHFLVSANTRIAVRTAMLDAYFERIGFDRPARRDFSTLVDIHRAPAEGIPALAPWRAACFPPAAVRSAAGSCPSEDRDDRDPRAREWPRVPRR